MNDYLKLFTDLPKDITPYEKTTLDNMIANFTDEELDELSSLYASMEISARESLTAEDLPPVSDSIYHKMQRCKFLK